jgi:serine/threonine protein kinase
MKIAATEADASVESLVGRIADEFTQRLNRGERPSVEEYADRYAQERPEIAALLREVLPALGLLRRPDVEAALADADPNLAAPLGDFRLLREVGHGAMGIVYEAKQLSLNRTVAVKVLPFAATLDPRQLQRFKNEAEAAARLHHEHVVPVYSIGCERGVHYYVMQYVDGLSLEVVIRELRRLAGLETADPQQTGPYLPAPSEGQDTSSVVALTTEGANRSPEYFRTVARLGLEAAEGLAHAHGIGVLHRDIKPANLLVDDRCSLWITDFGLAQMRSEARLTRTGELLGTLRYMSPEQALAKRVVVDERTDVYSLGAALYELLTLEPVFDGSDREELLRQIAFDDPRPPRRLNRLVHPDLEAVCLKCLEKDPRRRYASARELAEDLSRWLNGESTLARPLSRAGRVWRWVRRHPLTSAALAVLVAVALALPFVAYYLDPERIPRANAARVSHGEAVTLIPETDPPPWSKPVIGKLAVVEPPAHDGAFSFTSGPPAPSFLELMPAGPAHGYRFRVKVRHEDAGSGIEGTVGVYFLRSEFTTANGVEHAMCTFWFNEWKERSRDKEGKPEGWVVLEMQRRDSGRRKVTEPLGVRRNIPLVGQQPGGRPGWHEMAVTVSEASLRLDWDGERVGEIPCPPLAQEFQVALNNRFNPMYEPNLSPSFVPTGGLGVFVENGWASFRDAVVEPLDK